MWLIEFLCVLSCEVLSDELFVCTRRNLSYNGVTAIIITIIFISPSPSHLSTPNSNGARLTPRTFLMETQCWVSSVSVLRNKPENILDSLLSRRLSAMENKTDRPDNVLFLFSLSHSLAKVVDGFVLSRSVVNVLVSYWFTMPYHSTNISSTLADCDRLYQCYYVYIKKRYY